jgi:hypothetical protein
MVSTTSKGNYYKRKTKVYFEKLGYTVQLTEFVCALQVKGKCFYRKIDIFGSDGIAMNGKEIIFWNSKATTPEVKDGVSKMKSSAKLEFEKYPFPKNVKLQAVVWLPKQKPIIFNLNS